MGGQILHRLNDSVEFLWEERLLFRYTYLPRTDQYESPRPYFHPINTLKGNAVTLYRPADHRWHMGLSMTFAEISGENFWGGPTYVSGQGYRKLNNNGTQRHIAWKDMSEREGLPRLIEKLEWVTQKEERWLAEERSAMMSELSTSDSFWVLDFASKLKNVSGRSLVVGSPTTQGRPAAGYGSLFWRGARSFDRGRFSMAGGISNAEEAMGRSSPWLAYCGAHDGVNADSTLIFMDSSSNPRYPTKWFVRNEPGYTAVSYALTFDDEWALGPGDSIELNYRLAVADGSWNAERIEDFVKKIDS
jgi:hypothetical protein